MAISNIKMDIIARDKTKRAFRSVKQGVGKVTKSLFSLKTGIVSVAGVTGLGLLVKRSLDASDELAKMSRTVGVSVEALQRLRHAASLGGLEAAKLDKAIQKFAVNIADAAKNTGEAKDVFDEYGIAAQNADGSLRSVGEVLGDTAEVFKHVTNKTEKAEIAYRLFGARGGKMVNVLQDGKKALHETMLEADRLGLVMSEKTLKGVEAANDSMTRLGSYINATFARVVAELAPVIETVTDNIREWMEMKIDKEGGMGRVATQMANAVILAGISIIDAMEKIGNGLVRFIQNINTVMPAWMGGLRTVEEITDDLVDAQQRLAFATDDQTELMKLAARQVREYESELALAKAAGMDLSKIDMGPLRNMLQGLLIPITDLKTGLNEVGDGAPDPETLTPFMEKWNELSGQVQNTGEMMAATMFNATKSIGDAVGKTIVFGGDLGKSVKAILKNAAADIISFFATQKIRELAAHLFGKGLDISEAARNVPLTFSNALRSMAGAPFPLNLAAPAFAAEMSALSASTVGAVGAAAGGLETVPDTGTFLLHKGERVVQPEQNEQLTTFLEEREQGQTQVQIFLDGDVLAEAIGNMSRDGRLMIAAGAVS